MTTGVCLSVCLSVRMSIHVSVCRVPQLNLRMKRHKKPKIGRMAAHQRVICEPILRSKVKAICSQSEKHCCFYLLCMRREDIGSATLNNRASFTLPPIDSTHVGEITIFLKFVCYMFVY